MGMVATGKLRDAHARPQQIDFHEADLAFFELFLLLPVVVLGFAGELVGQAEKLNNRNDALACPGIDDFNVGFGNRFTFVMNFHRFGEGKAGLCGCTG